MLATDRGSAEVAGGDSQSALCRKIRQERERGSPLTTAQMTALAGVSRATYYRFDPDATPAVRDADLRDVIQRIALRFPAYGRPRITAELKPRSESKPQARGPHPAGRQSAVPSQEEVSIHNGFQAWLPGVSESDAELHTCG